MPNVVITADIHAHCYADSPTLPDGSNGRLADVLAALDGVLETAQLNKAEAIIVAGDLYHDRKSIKPEVSHGIARWLERCRDTRIPVHILVGNHDMSLDCSTHSTKALQGLAEIVDTSVVRTIAGVRFGFVPYVDDAQEARVRFAEMARGKARFVIGHLGLGDPKHSNCVPTDYEVSGQINLSDLRPDDFERVFLGHYHLEQDVGRRCQYIGSPLQLSFKEADHPKGWLVLDTATGSATTMANTISPKYHIVFEPEDVKGIPSTDFIWLKARNRAASLAAVELQEGRNLRIDRLPPPTEAPRIAHDIEGEALLTAYVKAVEPDVDPDVLRRRVAVGLKLQRTVA